jgi:hypothetical protein
LKISPEENAIFNSYKKKRKSKGLGGVNFITIPLDKETWRSRRGRKKSSYANGEAVGMCLLGTKNCEDTVEGTKGAPLPSFKFFIPYSNLKHGPVFGGQVKDRPFNLAQTSLNYLQFFAIPAGRRTQSESRHNRAISCLSRELLKE